MSPYKMSGTTVVSFSGGRTSAYLLRQVLDANDDLDDLIVTFANTGKEHPATLDFVNECSQRWQVPIVWLEYRDDERGFAIVTYETASRGRRAVRITDPQAQLLAEPGHKVLYH